MCESIYGKAFAMDEASLTLARPESDAIDMIFSPKDSIYVDRC